MTPRKTPFTDRGRSVLRIIADMADAEESRIVAMAESRGSVNAVHMAGWIAGVRSAQRILVEFITEIERDAAAHAPYVLGEHRRRADAYVSSYITPTDGAPS